MKYRRFVSGLSTAALLLMAGCAGPGAGSAGPVTLAAAPGSDVSGTWHGTLGWVGAYQYIDEARIALRIQPDGTFTATISPDGGTNNLAKASTLSGTVVERGRRVTLRNSQGPWPWLTLVRSGNTLYGVAEDPGSQANVMLTLARDGSRG